MVTWSRAFLLIQEEKKRVDCRAQLCEINEWILSVDSVFTCGFPEERCW